MLPSDGHVTTEDGVRLFFQKMGSGPKAVVILNGFYLFEDFKYLADGRTLIFLDLRNRGRSDHIIDGSKLKKGVQHDVDDLEAVRRHFGLGHVDVIGHSYAGLTVILYAMKYPAHVDRVVQIGPMQPNQSTQYPAHLTGADATLREFFAKAAELEKERASVEPREFCKRFWSLLRVLYVANPGDADKIKWARCDLPTELNLMKHWVGNILPSIQSLNLMAEELAKVKTPVLTVHGVKDRSAPYGGGREWALMLPNARLVTVENAAHAPWIEAPEKVFSSIRTFLDGTWPAAARKVESLDPKDEPAKQQ
jgi:proline iminopeptidase